MPDSLIQINREIVACRACPRLVPYRERIAREKRRAYREWTYWGKAVPSFGDPRGRLLIIGLAPAAHGANRTGRMFTGDSSGDLLFATLHRNGFASQPTATSVDDGLKLHDAWISATVHCAPPGNKPLAEESIRCRSFLERELDAFGVGKKRGGARPQLRVVVCLGKIAFDTYLAILRTRGLIYSRSAYKFAHSASYSFDSLPTLIASYHPSRQNTQTGRLTPGMFHDLFSLARRIVSAR